MSHAAPRHATHGADASTLVDRLRAAVQRILDVISWASAEGRDPARKNVPAPLGSVLYRAGRDGRFKAAHDEIDRLMSTLRPGWDAHRAARIAPEAGEAAKMFLIHAGNKFGTSLREPAVGPLADGALGLVWRVKRHSSEREVEVVFMRRGNEFVVSDRDGREPTIEGHDVDVDELIRVVDRYVVS